MIVDTCKKIKDKRRELGHSIEYVVEKTKLAPSVIRDIEAGDFSNINAAYLRGFVKIYAAFLDVDVGGSLDEIEDVKREQSKPKLIRIQRRDPVKEEIPSKEANPENKSSSLQKNIVAAIVGVVLLTVALVAAIFIVRAVVGAFSRPAVVKSEAGKSEEKVIVPQSNDLTASLTAKKKCFIRVVVDGKLLFEGVLEKGAVESWKADKEIEFKISDGSAIYLEVNGQAVPTLTAIRKPIKSLKITPSGISVDK